ncbi:NAD-dependent epimerase/dehydratase family protein [Aureimonas sp. AU40]|uniref:NAD-dependent epimerase/dehydratase family protein n=1 Tax=Aureimonas sp. AU40 TaxID=1637747 RepID=UPI0007802BEB
MSTVLVTGGSGFLGGQCILQLLREGHDVRATLRDLDRQASLRAVLEANGAAADAPLSFAAADLLSDAGWEAAVAGCDMVLHVASPFPVRQPEDENELIAPARDGSLRVLRAAREADVAASLLEPSQPSSDPAKRRDASGAKARRVLGWSPRSAREAIVASAESLLRLGLVV